MAQALRSEGKGEELQNDRPTSSLSVYINLASAGGSHSQRATDKGGSSETYSPLHRLLSPLNPHVSLSFI